MYNFTLNSPANILQPLRGITLSTQVKKLLISFYFIHNYTKDFKNYIIM